MPIETINTKGEIRLNRNKAVANVTGSREGSFTVGDVSDFVDLLRSTGAKDDTRILTHINGSTCTYFSVPVDNGVVPANKGVPWYSGARVETLIAWLTVLALVISHVIR